MKTETWFWVSSPNSHRASHDETCEVAGTSSAGAQETHSTGFYF